MRKLTPNEQHIVNGLRQGRELCEWEDGSLLLHFGHGKAPLSVVPGAFRSLLASHLLRQVKRTRYRTFYDLAEDFERD